MDYLVLGNSVIKASELRALRLTQDIDTEEYLILADWGDGEKIIYASSEKEEVIREFGKMKEAVMKLGDEYKSTKRQGTPHHKKSHKLKEEEAVKAAVLVAIEKGLKNYNEVKAFLVGQGYDGRQVRKAWRLVKEGKDANTRIN